MNGDERRAHRPMQRASASPWWDNVLGDVQFGCTGGRQGADGDDEQAVKSGFIHLNAATAASPNFTLSWAAVTIKIWPSAILVSRAAVCPAKTRNQPAKSSQGVTTFPADSESSPCSPFALREGPRVPILPDS